MFKTTLAWSAPALLIALMFALGSYGLAFNRGYEAGLRVVDVEIESLAKVVDRFGLG